MNVAQPILATQRTAARMLDMSVREFEELVEAGSLPRPAVFNRWNVDDLKQIASGKAAFNDDVIDL
jgi:hypothetical protein